MASTITGTAVGTAVGTVGAARLADDGRTVVVGAARGRRRGTRRRTRRTTGRVARRGSATATVATALLTLAADALRGLRGRRRDVAARGSRR